MTDKEKEEHRLKMKRAERARYRARYPERIAVQAREYKKKNPEHIKEKKKRYYLKYPEKLRAKIARYRTRYRERYPEKVKLEKTKARVRKMFVGVVDVEIKKLLVETKMLQIQLKHITSEKSK